MSHEWRKKHARIVVQRVFSARGGRSCSFFDLLVVLLQVIWLFNDSENRCSGLQVDKQLHSLGISLAQFS